MIHRPKTGNQSLQPRDLGRRILEAEAKRLGDQVSVTQLRAIGEET